MNNLLIAACALTLSVGAAFAQMAPDPTATPAAAPTTAVPSAVPQTGKEVRAQCRADAVAQGLKGRARKASVNSCFSQARPDLAKAQQCRKDATAKGLVGPARKSAVMACRAA